MLRALLFPQASMRHMQQLAALPEIRYALNIQATLPGKIHRPYLSLGLSSRQRARVLGQHDDFFPR